jgi:hypothetical protein
MNRIDRMQKGRAPRPAEPFFGTVAGAGGVNSDTNVAVTVCNSIIWGNSAPKNNNISGSISNRNSVVDGDDPLFSDSNYYLSYQSPCINAGDNSAVTNSTDLDGNARIVDTTVDMGCYEAYDDGSDIDVDSSTDYEEGVHDGTNPNLSDDDGSDDDEELFTGTDPLDDQSFFFVAYDGTTLSWPHTANRDYSLYGCTNLTENSWLFMVSTSSSNLMPGTAYDSIFYNVQAETKSIN